jgi:hypothetical protein
LEYKQLEEGKQLEANVYRLRQITKDRRLDIKRITDDLNKKKNQIDKLKLKLDRKEHERRQRLQ